MPQTMTICLEWRVHAQSANHFGPLFLVSRIFELTKQQTLSIDCEKKIKFGGQPFIDNEKQRIQSVCVLAV